MKAFRAYFLTDSRRNSCRFSVYPMCFDNFDAIVCVDGVGAQPFVIVKMIIFTFDELVIDHR